MVRTNPTEQMTQGRRVRVVLELEAAPISLGVDVEEAAQDLVSTMVGSVLRDLYPSGRSNIRSVRILKIEEV